MTIIIYLCIHTHKKIYQGIGVISESIFLKEFNSLRLIQKIYSIRKDEEKNWSNISKTQIVWNSQSLFHKMKGPIPKTEINLSRTWNSWAIRLESLRICCCQAPGFTADPSGLLPKTIVGALKNFELLFRRPRVDQF